MKSNTRVGIYFLLLLLVILLEGQGCGKKTFQSIPKEKSSSTELDTGSSPDTYYDYEWYMGGKIVPSTLDIGLVDVWTQKSSEINLGQDVEIAVVDPSSIYLNHPDLTENKDLTKSFNFVTPSNGTNTVIADGASHGTCVAGVIAARDLNGKGIRGVSSRSKISGRTISGSDTDIYDALTFKASETDIISNSYGPPDDLAEINQYYNASTFKSAINLSLQTGRGGLGAVFVWAAGNGKQNGDRSNYDGYASNPGVMSICSVNMNGTISFFSEPGSNLWVCAPGEKIVATDYQAKNCSDSSNSNNSDLPDSDYTRNFIGTSAATPVVAGVAGILLHEAKNQGKSLGWRDVKMIIAESATKNDSLDWQATRIRFNDEMGFGVVNVLKALELLKTWNPVGNSVWAANNWGGSFLVPESSGVMNDGDGSFVAMKNYTINNAAPENGVDQWHTNISYIEYAKLEIKLTHADPGDLEVSLTKRPVSGGTTITSKIATPHSCLDTDGLAVSCTSVSNYTFEFGVANFLGESAEGIWSLKIRDARANGKTGSVSGWRLTVYGH